MWLCCSISFLLCQPSCTGRKQLEDQKKKIKILSAAHLILFQVWNGCLWKVILCCQARSGGKAFRNDCIFPTTVFQHSEVTEPFMNLTLKIDVFCLSWTFLHAAEAYWATELLETHICWLNSNLTLTLLIPVAFQKRFLLSSKSSLHHLRINKKLCISTRLLLCFWFI